MSKCVCGDVNMTTSLTAYLSTLQVAVVAQLAGMRPAEPHDGTVTAALWGWEPRLQAHDVLQALVRSQREVLSGLAKEAAVRISALSGIAT